MSKRYIGLSLLAALPLLLFLLFGVVMAVSSQGTAVIPAAGVVYSGVLTAEDTADTYQITTSSPIGVAIRSTSPDAVIVNMFDLSAAPAPAVVVTDTELYAGLFCLSPGDYQVTLQGTLSGGPLVMDAAVTYEFLYRPAAPACSAAVYDMLE